jgi:hypothetical protein
MTILLLRLQSITISISNTCVNDIEIKSWTRKHGVSIWLICPSINYHPPPTNLIQYGGEQIIYGPAHVMPVQSRDNRPILTRSGFSTHTTPQSTTNFAMKMTSQHSLVMYQTKAKGMLYTYWHSFIILVFVYNDITCIVVREAVLENVLKYVSPQSKEQGH